MIAFATASNQYSFLVLMYGSVSLTPSNNLKVDRSWQMSYLLKIGRELRKKKKKQEAAKQEEGYAYKGR